MVGGGIVAEEKRHGDMGETRAVCAYVSEKERHGRRKLCGCVKVTCGALREKCGMSYLRALIIEVMA